MREKGRESDLKAGHVRLKNECDRTHLVYSIAFVLGKCM
jgi:hypothetical protein